MVRFPKFYGKKRGHRRTGSALWGSFGEGIFYAMFFVTGIVFGALLLSGVAVPEWRINHEFIISEGVVLEKRLDRLSREDPPGTFTQSWQPQVRLAFDVAGGIRHESWTLLSQSQYLEDENAAQSKLDAFSIGSRLPCWYDPENSDSVVLVRGYHWWMWLLTLLLPGALVILGGSGLVRVVTTLGKSEERRALQRSFPDILEPIEDIDDRSTHYPSVPTCDDLVNSPGTILRYRLPIESRDNWSLTGLGVFAVLWNAVVIVLAINAGFDLASGRSDPILFALLLPFFVIGLFGVVFFLRSFVLATAVGPTHIEISDHPLRPGGTYDVLVSQGGSGTLRSISVQLELEERATYLQGTDVRTEHLVVRSQPLKRWDDVRILPTNRFESTIRIEIPQESMHSFVSEHNSVHWKLVVSGDPERWRPFSRSFSLVVFPDEGKA